MKLTDERIINYLKKEHGENFDLESFLNVSLDALKDAKKFKNIDKIVARIDAAISSGEKILIYGDYDSDGVCASTILYLYLASRGADVDVYIPNRFENGYGMSVDAIEFIVGEFHPALVITVDLGITAIEEVEILHQEGIEVIVTDHHLPLPEVPNCLILDPKFDNSEYGFDALCGAGVAMKLVEALGGREEANKFLDIAAIATVGDIVPLVDENRAIAKVGIEKINRGDCHRSLSFLKSKLGIAKLNSTDISFKIVPRFNACGRIDDAIKVFKFLIETDERELEKKFQEIDSDNNKRLQFIDKGNALAAKLLQEFSADDPAIFVVGDFHEGIIGILASRISHDYNRPCIVFTKTENGTLKGSGRSIEAINLHQIIAGFAGMLENFGGHKMAVGLEIEPNIFEVFRSKVNLEIRRMARPEVYLTDNKAYDIEISDADFSEKFYGELELLEPFGEGNKKPVLAMKTGELSVAPVSEKAFKHYRCYTPSNRSFMAFGSYHLTWALASKSEKLIKIDLSTNLYNGKSYISASAKDVAMISAKFAPNEGLEAALFNLYYSIFDFNNKDKYHVTENFDDTILQLLKESDFGTLIVASCEGDFETIKRLNLEHLIAAEPYKSCQNAVVVGPNAVYSLGQVAGYKNIIFLSKFFNGEHLYFSQKHNVYESAKNKPLYENFNLDRSAFGLCYSLAKSNAGMKANDEIDWAKKLAIRAQNLSQSQVLFALIVFFELNFIEWNAEANEMTVLPSKKVDLDKSKFKNEVQNG